AQFGPATRNRHAIRIIYDRRRISRLTPGPEKTYTTQNEAVTSYPQIQQNCIKHDRMLCRWQGMVDVFDAKTRSRVMSRIRRKDTKPELALRPCLQPVGYATACIPGSCPENLTWS